jgi:DNA ligase-1
MRFMVFDLPAHPGTYRERYRGLRAVLATGGDAHVQAIEQRTLRDEASLRTLLDQTVRQGGEGLMLRRWDSPHRPGRSADLLKYKPEQDDDARVVGHLPGQGRHAGAMGALLVETPQGLRFRLGTGFSDAQRRQPPAIGSWVSYRYRSRTEAGVPRFATFLRARPDLVD